MKRLITIKANTIITNYLKQGYPYSKISRTLNKKRLRTKYGYKYYLRLLFVLVLHLS